MKNFTRAFVLVLALTGISAATYANLSSPAEQSGTAIAKASAFPIPTCPPNDPNACGMGGPNPNVIGTK